MIITFMIASEGAGFRIRSDVYGSRSALSAWYVNDKNWMTLYMLDPNHAFCYKIDTDFLAVVNHVPKIFTQLLNIDIFRDEPSVSFFAYAE